MFVIPACEQEQGIGFTLTFDSFIGPMDTDPSCPPLRVTGWSGNRRGAGRQSCERELSVAREVAER